MSFFPTNSSTAGGRFRCLAVAVGEGELARLEEPVRVLGGTGSDEVGALQDVQRLADTQLGFAVGAVAAVFGIQPGYGSTLRKRFREHGSAGLVTVSGRKAVLTPEVIATARRLHSPGAVTVSLRSGSVVGASRACGP